MADGMPAWDHGLGCSHARQERLEAASDEDIVREDAATSNVTDLRRARQRARGVIRRIQQEIMAYLQERGSDLFSGGDLSNPRRTNIAITELAAERFREELVSWLSERNRTTAGRAIRAAFDKMQDVVPVDADPSFRGAGGFAGDDIEVVRQVRQVDAGLLYDTELARELGLDEPLAQELGNDITRQLRQGIRQGETISGGLRDRVEMVITDGDAPERQEKGISGQTKRSKAELIAHDSVQDAYNSAARKRYMENGFRFAVYDATIDTKTTDLCRRMNEHVIDIVDQPWMVPPLHPYCRSGIRPVLDPPEDALERDDIADGFLQTIFQTKSYRPPSGGDFRPTPLTREYGQD